MWVNRKLFDHILMDNKSQSEKINDLFVRNAKVDTMYHEKVVQKAKDDITIDWMRHRINALEKQNAILMQKAMGVAFPVPEIVPTRPNSISPDYLEMPSFEDLGDAEAARLGIKVNDAGTLEYTK